MDTKLSFSELEEDRNSVELTLPTRRKVNSMVDHSFVGYRPEYVEGISGISEDDDNLIRQPLCSLGGLVSRVLKYINVFQYQTEDTKPGIEFDLNQIA